jgi:hypothetical protein
LKVSLRIFVHKITCRKLASDPGSATLPRIKLVVPYTVYSSYRTGEPRPAAAQAGKVPGARARHHLRRDVQGRVEKPGFKKNPVGFFGFFWFFFGFLGFFRFFVCFWVFWFFLCICPEERVFSDFHFQEYFKVHPDFKL